MNPADFLAAKVYTGSKNIALIGKSQEFGMGMYMNRAAKRLLYLGAAVSFAFLWDGAQQMPLIWQEHRMKS